MQETNGDQIPLTLLEEFVNNTNNLSQQSDVFDSMSKAIRQKRSQASYPLVSMIKTHNKRIYMKLNVLRKELLLYINMLKDIGQEFQ